MWTTGVYELLANERIAEYQREAALEREIRTGVKEQSGKAPASMTTTARSSRRALGASFLGLAAMAVLRRRSPR